MPRSIFGQYSKDGYGYWGYVEVYKRMMLFTSPEEYLEYISEQKHGQKEPYWKQQGSSYFSHKRIGGASNDTQNYV